LASICIELPLYIFLHEGGHSLVAILCGAKITHFSILNAHINSQGGIYNTFTSSLLNIAGVLFPLFWSFLCLIFYCKNKENDFYRIFTFFICLMPVGSVFAWVLVPVLYMLGNAPANDDVTKFINNSGIHPLWVILCAILILSAMITFAWYKKVIQNFKHTVNEKSNLY